MQAMQTWQYRVVDPSPFLFRSPLMREDDLDDLGAEGWELAGVVPYKLGNKAKMIFKRPVMDD